MLAYFVLLRLSWIAKKKKREYTEKDTFATNNTSVLLKKFNYLIFHFTYYIKLLGETKNISLVQDMIDVVREGRVRYVRRFCNVLLCFSVTLFLLSLVT